MHSSLRGALHALALLASLATMAEAAPATLPAPKPVTLAATHRTASPAATRRRRARRHRALPADGVYARNAILLDPSYEFTELVPGPAHITYWNRPWAQVSCKHDRRSPAHHRTPQNCQYICNCDGFRMPALH